MQGRLGCAGITEADLLETNTIAGHAAGLATPLAILPGSTLIGMAPFAAIAEAWHQPLPNHVQQRAGQVIYLELRHPLNKLAKKYPSTTIAIDQREPLYPCKQ
jgi:hypothetical protein